MLLVAAAAVALPSTARPEDRCSAKGEPIHWIADYCMLKLETDDEIAASDCIEKELKRKFRNRCAAKLHFKKGMCEAMIRSQTRSGSVAQCVRDPKFMGRTVAAGGVGGSTAK
jgi:hypothetical protein